MYGVVENKGVIVGVFGSLVSQEIRAISLFTCPVKKFTYVLRLI